jgi:phosphoglycolate phosphatase-like HAD superfamily hydrolase
MLRSLQDQGYRVAVFSDKRSMFGTPELAQAGVGELVDYALFLEEGRPYKPDPTGLRQVLDALHVSPGETLYVGDSRHDVQCAHRAGVTSAAALWGSVDREGVLAHQPHYLLEKVEQVFQALDDQAAR